MRPSTKFSLNIAINSKHRRIRKLSACTIIVESLRTIGTFDLCRRCGRLNNRKATNYRGTRPADREGKN